MSSAAPRRHRQIRALETPSAATRDPGSMVTKTYKRSRNGCYTCRLRRKKCDESHPSCGACASLNVSCEYRKPSWWISTDARNLQKNKIKEKVRETKVLQKETALKEYMRHALPSPAIRETHTNPDPSKPQLQMQPQTPAQMPEQMPAQTQPQAQQTYYYYDPSASYLPTPTTAPLTGNSFEMNTVIGENGFSQDLQDPNTLQQSISTMYNPMGPPPVPISATTTPALQSEEWYQGFVDPPVFHTLKVPPAEPNSASSELPDRPLSHYLEARMSKSDRERRLLYHFVDNVLRLMYPVLDLHKEGPSRAREILVSLDSNKSYYHCCLSVSAIHLKTIKKHRGVKINNDIMVHRYRAVSELCRALNSDRGHDTILDATLAMIFFHCSVGAPNDDTNPDVPWHDHFSTVKNLINTHGLVDTNPFAPVSFNMSLSAWVDILGSTMLAKAPEYINTYRTKHLNGISSGLRELMGCEDSIMYTIAEIACVDALKNEGDLDDFAVCNNVASLIGQLDCAEDAADLTLQNPLSPGGTIQAGILTKNMTSIFRTAARIYLYSLLPGFENEQQSTIDLVDRVTSILQYIPTGPYGFDRSLVWPMLITGAASVPTSTFRTILAQRSNALGECSDFGSFGRMYQVLQEVWKLSDDPSATIYADPGLFSSSTAFAYDQTTLPSPRIETIGRRIKKQPVHWREAMRRREWSYLLL
ncbi:fungal-specific transcription factor domain-containing protein [Aspergillus insuetus]